MLLLFSLSAGPCVSLGLSVASQRQELPASFYLLGGSLIFRVIFFSQLVCLCVRMCLHTHTHTACYNDVLTAQSWVQIPDESPKMKGYC